MFLSQSKKDFGLEEGEQVGVPDISVDPDTRLLSAINPTHVERSVRDGLLFV